MIAFHSIKVVDRKHLSDFSLSEWEPPEFQGRLLFKPSGRPRKAVILSRAHRTSQLRTFDAVLKHVSYQPLSASKPPQEPEHLVSRIN